jgi:alkyl hydroperoxide reductase subunit AhpC
VISAYYYFFKFKLLIPSHIEITINDLPVGRSVDETLRIVEALQFSDKNGVVCPIGWKKGDKPMIADPEKAKEYFNAVN